MQLIQLYYFDPYTYSFKPIEDTQYIPVVLDENRLAYTRIMIKNISDKTLSNVEIDITGTASGISFTTAINETGNMPAAADFTSAMTYALTNELPPQGTFDLFLAAVGTEKMDNIDISELSLDITYYAANFSVNDLIAHFEFTEARNSTTVYDSRYNRTATITGSVSGKPAIQGDGILRYGNSATSCSYTFPAGTYSELSFFGKFKFDDSEEILLNYNETIKLSLNTNGNLVFYSSVGPTTKTTEKSITDRTRFYLIGLSVKDGELIISVDNEIWLTDTVDIPDYSNASAFITGLNIQTEISDLAYFSAFKSPYLHQQFRF